MDFDGVKKVSVLIGLSAVILLLIVVRYLDVFINLVFFVAILGLMVLFLHLIGICTMKAFEGMQ